MLRQAHRKIYLFALAVLAACGIFVLSAPLLCAQAPAGTFLSFDAPGAVQGTLAVAINRSGLIVGNFVDGSGAWHGFMRAPDGTFTIVDVPGSTGTYITAVNSMGLVAGYTDSDTGFLRYLNGTFVTLNAFQGTNYTIPVAMNDIGQIAGYVGFSFPISRGFLRSPNQSFKIFKVPEGGSWVSAVALNSSGVIAGSYPDAKKQRTVHAFLRDNAGNFTSFDATDSTVGTAATAINSGGQVAGWYLDTNNEQLPFLRDADGTITLFTVGTDPAQPTSINDLGVVVGTAYGLSSENAFERDAAGNVTVLPLPFINIASTAAAINLSGRIVGTYYDATLVAHGWLMTP